MELTDENRTEAFVLFGKAEAGILQTFETLRAQSVRKVKLRRLESKGRP